MGIGTGALEGLVSAVGEGPFDGAYAGRTVLVTGHTGFKGSWLSLWLTALGADVVGYALEPPTDPSAFEVLGLEEHVTDERGDIRDLERLRSVFDHYQPEAVFHLAAQPLVRPGYDQPVLTYETNVMGTVNVLEAVRSTPSVRAVVAVTSDKCYENREWEYAYRENDPMGGHDPYSSSKGCAELVVAAYRRSFFADRLAPLVASARAGNVIGGGDWAADRLIPDCVRALSDGLEVLVRNPGSVRPWQHVLEPLAGYLWLAACLLEGDRSLASAWNFGPGPAGHETVAEVVAAFAGSCGSLGWKTAEPAPGRPHEAGTLKLDIAKAADVLGWRPVWETGKAVEKAAAWYRAHLGGDADLRRFSLDQIAEYVSDASLAGVAWAAR